MNKIKKATSYTIDVEGKKCKLKPINRATLKIVIPMVMGENPKYIDAGQIILNTCWIEGDDELRDDKNEENLEYNFSACFQAFGLIEMKTGSLKKN